MRGIVALVACGLCLSATGARADDQAELRGILDRAIRAHGGADALAKLQAGSWQAVGQMYNLGPTIEYKSSGDRVGADKARLTVETTISDQPVKRTIVIDGDHGWVEVNGRAQDLDAETLAEEKERAFATWVASLTPLISSNFELQAVAATTVNNRPAIGVRVVAPGHRPIVLYFDQEAGLLVKKATTIHEPHGKGADELQETYYGAYELVDGVRIARHIQVHRHGELSLDCRYTSMHMFLDLPRQVFERPQGVAVSGQP
jgi:hypothetical protein